jgi:hypothetical protein
MGGGGRALYAVGGASHNFVFIYSLFSLPNRDGKGGWMRSILLGGGGGGFSQLLWNQWKPSVGLIPERLERDGPCLLLKLRWMKGVLRWLFAGLVVLVEEIFLFCLACFLYFNSSVIFEGAMGQPSTLQMKGQSESNINVWSPFIYSQKWICYLQNQNYNFLSSSSYIHISVRDLYISRIGPPILLQGNMWTSCSQTHECGNWDRGRAIPRKGIHKWDFPCSARWTTSVCDPLDLL